MALNQTMEVIVRAREGGAEILFTPLKGLEPLRDGQGSIVRFGIPLDRTDAELAELVRNLARWVADLVDQDVKAQVAAVNRATAKKP